MSENKIYLEEADSFFQVDTINHALKLLQLSRASVSFSKGAPDNYFIVSGIVRDNRAHETKLIYKRRLKESEEGPLSSNCDCYLWNDNKHCPHVATLYYHFLLQLYPEIRDQFNIDRGVSLTHRSNSFLSVTPEKYGTIITAPHKLLGAPPNSTYSSMQYLLDNNKSVNFPVPQKMLGKLVILIDSFDDITNESEFNARLSVKFQYQDEDNSTHEKISIFENLYLFNWTNGTVLHFEPKLKTLVRKLRFGTQSSIDQLIRILLPLKDEGFIDLKIDDVYWDDIESKPMYCKITLDQATKTSLINFNILFATEEDKSTSVPEIISSLTFNGGQLHSFRRKKDAYNFIDSIPGSFEVDTSISKKYLIGNNYKSEFVEQIDFLNEVEHSYSYHSTRKVLYRYDNFFVKKFMSSIIKNFTHIFFRFSEFDSLNNQVNFQLSKKAIFNGLSDFYHEVEPLGVEIYYDKKQLSQWKSRVHFERRSHSMQWFDLTLKLDQKELDLIRNADVDSGISLTDKGLVLLSKDQKDLIRLMKKYTQYEGVKENTPEGVVEAAKEDDLLSFTLPFQRARIFELFELRKMGIDGALTDEEVALCEKLATLENVPSYEIPEDFDNVLRPYQKVGHNWLRFLYESKLGACLADDMGLGKTIQAISFIRSIYDSIDKVLIVCPVTLLLNWENEFKKFFDIPIHIYHGSSRVIESDTKIILTSYGVMKKEAETTFANFNFDVFILDEVQQLKNMRSLGAFAARKIKANFRICMTGTPVENDLSEFYNIVDLCIPGIWGDLAFIRSNSSKKGRLTARKTASPFVLRRTKDEVLLDLPPKIENNIYLNFNEEEDQGYKNNLLSIKNRIQTSPSKKRYGEILKGLLELRQKCLWQNFKPSKKGSIPSVISTKIEFLLDTLEQIIEEGHQAIVFSQFTTYLDILQTFVSERHWKQSRIDGSQSIKRRQKEVDEFQAGKTSVFLISLKAGGVGLNLTAASYVFVMDPWWNPAVENQAIDRAHRIGQKNTLTVYRPIIKDSVEEKVLELQNIKKELFSDLLQNNEEHSFSGKLSMKDFENLLS